LPGKTLEKLYHTFIKMGIPSRLKDNELIAKWDGEGYLIEEDTIAGCIRIVLLTNISLYEKHINEAKLRRLLYANFELTFTKIGIDPEGYLIAIIERPLKPENCLEVNTILEDMKKLKIDYNQVKKLLKND